MIAADAGLPSIKRCAHAVHGFFMKGNDYTHMQPHFNHTIHESLISEQWKSSQVITPLSGELAKATSKPAFCIIMPPPNANDPLHVGHALFVTIEDILIRFERMRGKFALWLPGTDHAGIETQYVFEKKLAKQGKSRFSFDRESLYQMIHEYVTENSAVALEQMKRLGASADWSRTMFTLDEAIVDQVLTTFEEMHKEGLIDRQQALVNFSPKAGTSFSELEVLYEKRTSPLYYIKYRREGLDEFVVVATTRPEPIFADTHLAVNPKDTSKQHLLGTRVHNPLTDELMDIIGDDFVDPQFGTGVVKLTPAHDWNDFEVGKRHALPLRQAVDVRGKITKLGGVYAGMSVKQARAAVVQDLQAKGLIEKIDKTYVNRVGTCYKTGGDIEPLPLAQFFIKTTPLAQEVMKRLDAGETVIHGAGHDKILRHWLESLRDWNISRQIVWGIRMPVWYQVDLDHNNQNSKIVVGFLDHNGNFQTGEISALLEQYGFEEIERGLQTMMAPIQAKYVVSRAKPNREGLWLQETDTFDTWFSSSQWPVVTLKASLPGDFDYYYPTSVMETGYDILPFWVMRMMLMGVYLTDRMPFKEVYLHGLARDEKGMKMSKSKGNVINPIEVVDKYGADALRMALVMSTTAGLDSTVGEQKIRGMRNFANKVWNAGRFVSSLPNQPSQEADRELLDQAYGVLNKIEEELDRRKIGNAAETIYKAVWHWYCDECIELSKQGQYGTTAMRETLALLLKGLHPFMPFVTEAVWKELALSEKLLIAEAWPDHEDLVQT